jgi:short-subunit dehydrogenase
MKLNQKAVLLTGASGGIGRCLTRELVRHGARLALAGRNEAELSELAQRVNADGGVAVALPIDLSEPSSDAALVERAEAALGCIDVLVNNAGLSSFGPFYAEDDAAIRRIIDVNLTAPMLLVRAALPGMLRRRLGHIVNIGSAFGSIAFPDFAAYSTTKFALRGFSEALRRELAGSGVRITYVAPRTTDTTMNTQAVRAFVARTGAAMDRPETVAQLITNAIEQDRSEVYIGWPERLLVRVNGVVPRLVDWLLAGKAGSPAIPLERADSSG